MDALGKPSCILLRGDPIYGEATATAAIMPGQLVVTTSTARTLTKDNTVGLADTSAVAPIFARENEVVGKGVDDGYAIGDNVLLMHSRRGDWVFAWLNAGQSVVGGQRLEAGAGGGLDAATSGVVIARALETINNAGAEAVRIKVEVV